MCACFFVNNEVAALSDSFVVASFNGDSGVAAMMKHWASHVAVLLTVTIVSSGKLQTVLR